jgi:hypothetical protein
LVCGAVALIEKDDNGVFKWKENPTKFFERNLDKLLKTYKGVIDQSNWDPQSVGKGTSWYNMVQDLVAAYSI